MCFDFLSLYRSAGRVYLCNKLIMKNDWEDEGGETVVGMCHMREESILNLKKKKESSITWYFLIYMILMSIYKTL